ncbi:MAG: hypothetical protein AB7F86_15325 [Bdellovibrionales bacterium]
MRVILLALMFLTWSGWAQMVEVQDDDAPTEEVGKEKAQDYFKARKTTKATSSSTEPGATPRFLMVHLGGYFSDQGYKWGDGDQSNLGRLNAGVTYRMGEWVNSMDFSMRIDYSGYSLEEGDARKLSFGGIITFPDANANFPLYFGIGLGMGFFIKQVNEESALALDYSVLAGARFRDIIGKTGFMVESGLKNHLHLLSDGQFNGVYVNVGCVWAF